jgi:hypothetical protein
MDKRNKIMTTPTQKAQAERFLKQYRICGLILWVGVLVNFLAYGVIKIDPTHPAAGLLLTSAGLCIVASMFLRRLSLKRQLLEQRNHVD